MSTNLAGLVVLLPELTINDAMEAEVDDELLFQSIQPVREISPIFVMVFAIVTLVVLSVVFALGYRGVL